MLVGAMKKVGNPTFYTSLLHHPHCHLLNLLQNFVNIINHSISFNTIFGHLHDFLFIILCHCRLMIKKMAPQCSLLVLLEEQEKSCIL